MTNSSTSVFLHISYNNYQAGVGPCMYVKILENSYNQYCLTNGSTNNILNGYATLYYVNGSIYIKNTRSNTYININEV
jgi:hypothetical protein